MSGGSLETKAAVELIKLAIKQGWFQKLIDAFKTKHKVLVLGSTGVGKTNLIESITDITPEAIHHMNRTEFTKKHHIKISKNPFVFIDTPGQAAHKHQRREGILEVLKSPVAGIINVVSYGYHEYRIGSSDVFDEDGNIYGDFLQRHRQMEIDALNEWIPVLGSPEIVKWVVTVVSKADLWWDEKNKVIKYYESGEYFNNLGDAKSIHHVAEYCSVVHRFFGKGKISAIFDDAERIRTRVNLLRMLTEAIGKK